MPLRYYGDLSKSADNEEMRSYFLINLVEKERARQGTSNIGADDVDNYDEARSGEVTKKCEVIFSSTWWKKNKQDKANRAREMKP